MKMIRNEKCIRIKLKKLFYIVERTDGKGSPGGGKRPAERKMRHCQRQILCSWRSVCPLKAYWELDSPVGTEVLLYDPGGGGKGENVCWGHLSTALLRIILRSYLLTHTPPRWVKDTFPYLRIPLIM